MSHRTSLPFGPPPPFKHLSELTDRSILVQLRESVAPLLENNLLHHFTDHTVKHSDNVCNLVDDIVDELQSGDNYLSPAELIILYSACYLHDLGMQYEQAGQTRVIQELSPGIDWEKLPAPERRTVLRDKHNFISAELITSSVSSATPPVGLHLTSRNYPTQVACLCEAHCITPTTEAYKTLTQPVPKVRMALLSGVLRLADILDESCHRASREKARTLELNLESQVHWWRHYYTKDVEFDCRDKVIRVSFEFPCDWVEAYSSIVPTLQLPWIEKELQYHRAEFGKHGIHWSLQEQILRLPHSTVETMPEAVYFEMVKWVRNRQTQAHELSRQVAIQTFLEARPLVQERLKALQQNKDSLPPAEYLEELAELSFRLWDLGSERSAWMSLVFDFERFQQHLEPKNRVLIGTRLLRMLVGDDQPRLASSWMPAFHDAIKALPSNGERLEATMVVADVYRQLCEYRRAVETYEEARSLLAHSSGNEVLNELEAALAEMHFLQSNITSVFNPI